MRRAEECGQEYEEDLQTAWCAVSFGAKWRTCGWSWGRRIGAVPSWRASCLEWAETVSARDVVLGKTDHCITAELATDKLPAISTMIVAVSTRAVAVQAGRSIDDWRRGGAA